MSKPNKFREAFKTTAAKLRQKPLWVAAAVVGALILAGGVYVAIEGAPDWGVVNAVQDQFSKPTLAELIERTKKDPSDADAHLALGHALFESNRRGPGLRSYERALVKDRSLVDETMITNLVKSFGTKDQGNAASLITRLKLVEVEPKLDNLAKDKRYKVRWGALQTLERLGKASRADFINAWIVDLDSSDCDVRRHAVENLGKEGDKRALSAIRKAKEADKGTGNWFTGTCLGGRADEAEKRILAVK